MSYMGEIDHLLVWTLLLSRGFFSAYWLHWESSHLLN